MGCSRHGGPGRWHRNHTGNGRSGPEAWFRGRRRPASSGNSAFDEYREEALRRLEGEQQEFMEFLDHLRQAKDKAEFDEYMAERKRRAAGPDEPDTSERPSPQPQG